MLLDKKMASTEAELKFRLYRVLSGVLLNHFFPPMSLEHYFIKMTIKRYFSSG